MTIKSSSGEMSFKAGRSKVGRAESSRAPTVWHCARHAVAFAPPLPRTLPPRFVREAGTFARLDPPPRWPIDRGGGPHNEVLYIFRRGVGAPGRRQLLEKKGRLSARKAATIARQ